MGQQCIQRNHFLALFLIILLLPFDILGQDPYVGIFFNITQNDSVLTKQLSQEYRIFHRVSNKEKNEWISNESPVSYNDKYKKYEYIGSYDTYCGEIHELKITHNLDTMIIRLKWSFTDTLYQNDIYYRDCLVDDCWFCGVFTFKLKIPFQKGYYEITEFDYRTRSPSDNFQWEPIQIKDRKLLISGQ